MREIHTRRRNRGTARLSGHHPGHSFAFVSLTHDQDGGSFGARTALESAVANVPDLLSLIGKVDLFDWHPPPGICGHERGTPVVSDTYLAK